MIEDFFTVELHMAVVWGSQFSYSKIKTKIGVDKHPTNIYDPSLHGY